MSTRVQAKARTSVRFHYRLFETAFGVCATAWTGRGLSRVLLPGRDAAAIEQRLLSDGGLPWTGVAPADIARCCAAITDHLAGTKAEYHAYQLDFDSIGSLDRRIYEHLRDVPWGGTTTYGALAQAAGVLGAARAVGGAMARNPWPVIVPCHRVLASGGRIGGFSAPGGTVTKRRLLALEGAASNSETPLLPGLLTDLG